MAGGGVVVTPRSGAVRACRAPGCSARRARRPSPARRRPAPSRQPGADIKGPLNILLVGIDTRVSEPDWEPHADAVLILHVPTGWTGPTCSRCPATCVVDIPRVPEVRLRRRAHQAHPRDELRQPGRRGKQQPSTAQGFQLLARTVSGYTGITRFDAGAVLNFAGFDQAGRRARRRRPLRRPAGRLAAPAAGRPASPAACAAAATSGRRWSTSSGRRHLNGWQALDYARQRYTHRRRLRPAAAPAAARSRRC